ncbi:MAG: phosphoribosylglycinamide formyltransferase [Planctomycetia bacterium]|nr:phosphoribosylglycinamide formyltransferase [Planctomycetia bacterium]
MNPRAFPLSPLRLAVLISGGGTTLRNLIERIAQGRLDARIEQVVSSSPDVAGVEIARRAGLPTKIAERKNFPSVEAFSDEIFSACRAADVDLVAMGGFLKLVRIPTDFHMRVMNIHPALIPLFCGKGFHGRVVHEAVLDRGCKVSGCTVHFVDNEYDHGPIIVQQAVPVLDGDTPETLAARVFTVECELYPKALALYAAGKLRGEGRRVRISP